MRKKLLVIILIMIACVVICIIIAPLLTHKVTTGEGDTYYQNIKIINDTYPTKVVIYGDNVIFRKTFKYEKINNLNEDSLNYDSKNYMRLVLIINDLSSSVNIGEGTYEILKSKIDNNSMDLYYFGTSKVGDFIRYGLWKGQYNKGEDLSMGTALYCKNQTYFTGIWTKYDSTVTSKNEEAIGSVIVNQIARCIKSNN